MTETDGGLWCVVPAAGRGERFGADIPKQYLPVAGKPLLQHTLERLATHPRIAGLVAVLAPDDAYWPGHTDLYGKPVLTAEGGSTRADSVLSGLYRLAAMLEGREFVLIHDAARPCVHHADISRLIDLGIAAGGALLAQPLQDTLKRADRQGRVAATEPRDVRWRAMTPQMFRCGELLAALEVAREAGIAVTDESMAMEHTGRHPLLVAGREDNIKVTTPGDLDLAAYLLSRS